MTTDVLQAIDKLIKIVQKYKLTNIQVQVEYLVGIKNKVLDEYTFTEREKITLYNSLFPPRGGLSDVNFWSNDFGLRKTVNSQISESKNIIANFLLDR